MEKRDLSLCDQPPLTILSLLNSDLEKRLHQSIQADPRFELSSAASTDGPGRFERMLDPSFWSDHSRRFDNAVVSVSGNDLEDLAHLRDHKQHVRESAFGLWSGIPTAVVALLTDDRLADVVRAAQLDFDGILVEPFFADHLYFVMRQAVQRSRRRLFLHRRFHKLHHLFRTVNRDRRQLRNKIDLLCRDLVQSNTNLTNTLQDLRRAYDFQTDLTGEFDRRYLLHKALRHLKEQFADTSGIIYLCRPGALEAHVSGPWYDRPGDLREIESALQKTIIEKVCQTHRTHLIPEAGQWSEIPSAQRKKLAGLTLMALPLVLENELIGVLVFYRDWNHPFGEAENHLIAPYLQPLVRAIGALDKLQHLIIT